MKKMLFIVAAPIALMAVLIMLMWGKVSEAEHGVLSTRPEHGVVYTLLIQPAGAPAVSNIQDVQAAIAKRLASFGTQVFWEDAGSNQFRAYVPVSDAEAVSAVGQLLSAPGKVELRLVHVESRALSENSKVPDGYEVLTNIASSRGSQGTPEVFLVSRTPGSGGAAEIRFSQAYLSKDSLTGNFEIGFKLAPESAEDFRKITRENVGRQLAIVMDGLLLSAPVIRSEIAQGVGVISGNFDRIKAAEMASELQTPLPTKVTVLDSKQY